MAKIFTLIIFLLIANSSFATTLNSKSVCTGTLQGRSGECGDLDIGTARSVCFGLKAAQAGDCQLVDGLAASICYGRKAASEGNCNSTNSDLSLRACFGILSVVQGEKNCESVRSDDGIVICNGILGSLKGSCSDL